MNNHHEHRAGFVAIIGAPNAGKSTLMNQLLGEELVSVHGKVQTTRHSILGIVSKKNLQIIFTDTPGMIDPKYGLHISMMQAVKKTVADADLVIWLVDVTDFKLEDALFDMTKLPKPILLVLNKIDLAKPAILDKIVAHSSSYGPNVEVMSISALRRADMAPLVDKITTYLPVHPPYYPADMLTDRSERFFVQEMIRKVILDQYQQEIPYSVEVVINDFKTLDNLIKIQSYIYVERTTQKVILIGTKGQALNQLGIQARIALEAFFQKKIFLHLRVKLAPNWRKNPNLLARFGYPKIKPI